MRILSIVCIVGAALAFPMGASAKEKAGQNGGGQDIGSIHQKCRVEATGTGGTGGHRKNSIQACMERAKGGAH
jgi:hypothetical protein